MKKILFMLLMMSSISLLHAQKPTKESKQWGNKTLFEGLTNVQKRTDKFNLYLNMQAGFDAIF